MTSTDARLVLVTGASQGIGRAAALALAAAGNHVIACARSQKALETLDDEIKSVGGVCTLVPLDLTDAPAIDRLGGVVYERWGRLDGLLGNAGVLGTIGPIQTVKPASFEKTIEVNLTSNWRLIRAFDPLLKLSPAGRAVFVTSGVVPRPRAFWGPYQASKAGLEWLVDAWAKECDNFPLNINLYDPGAVRTSMRAEAMPGEDPDTLPSPDTVAADLIGYLSADYAGHNQRLTFARG